MRRFPAVALAALSVLVIGVTMLASSRRTASPTLNISTGVAPPVYTVSSGIDPTGATDVSAKMAAFFASVPDGSTIQLGAQALYRMDQTLVLNHRHNLTINGNYALFFEVTTGTSTRSNFRLENSSSIVIYNLTVRGANPNAGTGDLAYVATLEHQHGYELLSDTSVVLYADNATDVYGDFVYISSYNDGAWSDGITVMNGHFARNGRQGFSVLAARHVVISQNSISEVRASTFDFEPAPQNGVDTVTLANNIVGVGRSLFIAANGHGPVNNITVSGNRLSGQALQVWAQISVAGLRNNWKIFSNSSNLAYGTPKGALMQLLDVNGFAIHDNTQPFQPNRNMVVAQVTSSCTVVVANDIRPGSVGESRVTGTC